MIDINNKVITEEQLHKLIQKNTLFKKIKRKAEKVGIEIEYAYICDDYPHFLINNKKGIVKLYVDGLNADKTLKIRIYRQSAEVFSINGDNSVTNYENYVKKHIEALKFVKWLANTEMSELVTVYEKTDLSVQNGAFDNTIKNGFGENIRKQLCTLYNVYSVVIKGIHKDNTTYVITKNETHAKTYFSAKFDLHIFSNGKLSKTYTDFITSSGSYSDFFIDKVIDNNATDALFDLAIRKVVQAGHKHFEYHSATWTVKNNLRINKGSFVVTKTFAED